MPRVAPAPRRRPAGLAPAAVALLLALPAAGARAQVVTGQVVDAGGVPLPSAVVTLRDTADARIGAQLSDSLGRFVLQAPGPGRYRAAAERVGSLSALSPVLTLGPRDSVHVRLVLGAPLPLAAVTVTARERCAVRPRDGEIVARLWSEARNALESTWLARSTLALPAVRLARVRKLWVGDGVGTLKQARWTLAPPNVRLFRSIPAEELAREGFVQIEGRQAGDTIVFRAPDADVLLSDEFLATHCLRLVEARRERPTELGLGVEPVRRRGRVSDVKGTLWIDTTSFELREFEFRYVDLPPEVPSGFAGGTVTFARLPDGMWYIDYWSISMPTYVPFNYVQTAFDLTGTAQVVTGQLAARIEQGGRTLMLGEPRRAGQLAAVISGTVEDSTDGGRRVGGVRVALGGTPYEAETDEDGEFYLEASVVGVRPLRFDSPRAASLGLRWDVPINIQFGGALRVRAVFPSVKALRAMQCAPGSPADAPLLMGLVQELRPDPRRLTPPTLRPVPNATVEVEWQEPDATGAPAPRHRSVPVDADGRFRLCDLPGDVEVAVRARAGRRAGEAEPLRIARGGVHTRDIIVGTGRRP